MTVMLNAPTQTDRTQGFGESKERSSGPSMAGRLTRILEIFPGPNTRLSLEQVATATSLPRSTAHRILDQLVELGWVEHSNGYHLGRQALGLGGGIRFRDELRAVAAPHLHELMLTTNGVVHLAVLDGTEVTYLDKLGGRFAAQVPSRVGGSAPAHCTSLGKSILAALSAEEVDATMSAHLPARTTATIIDRSALHGELVATRQRRGLAFERGECFSHLACTAVPIRDSQGQPVAAVSVTGPSEMTLERVAPPVVAAARAISRGLQEAEDAALERTLIGA